MLNNLVIMGRLVADPVLRKTSNGISVVSFRIACDRSRKGGTDSEKKADFFDCTAWRERAEFINNYFVKGKPILLEGSVQNRDWKDKDGNQRRTTEIVVWNAHFCGGDKVTQAPVMSPGAMDVQGGLDDVFGDAGTIVPLGDDESDLPF